MANRAIHKRNIRDDKSIIDRYLRTDSEVVALLTAVKESGEDAYLLYATAGKPRSAATTGPCPCPRGGTGGRRR